LMNLHSSPGFFWLKRNCCTQIRKKENQTFSFLFFPPQKMRFFWGFCVCVVNWNTWTSWRIPFRSVARHPLLHTGDYIQTQGGPPQSSNIFLFSFLKCQ
jgi:hypothetical protein